MNTFRKPTLPAVSPSVCAALALPVHPLPFAEPLPALVPRLAQMLPPNTSSNYALFMRDLEMKIQARASVLTDSLMMFWSEIPFYQKYLAV